MSAAQKQRGATQGQLQHRSQLLLAGIRCIACKKTLGEHTEATWRQCHRRKSLAPLAALVMVASVARG